MSGSLGALAVLTGLASPGVRVSDRTALDGWLEPWMFLAVTVTSYIVNGTRFPTTALFVPLETYKNSNAILNHYTVLYLT